MQNLRPLLSVLVVAEVCNCLSLQVTIQGSVEVVFLSVLFSKSMQKLRPLLSVLVVTEVCACLLLQITV